MFILCFILVLVSFTEANRVILSEKELSGPNLIASHNGKYIYLCKNSSEQYLESIIYEDSVVLGDNIGWNLDILDDTIDNKFTPISSGKNVVIYVIDSGITLNENEYNVIKGPNYCSENGQETVDLTGHGTHIASIIASKTYGIAKNSTLIDVKIFCRENSAPISRLLQAIYWVIKQKKGLVNLSMSGPYNIIVNNAVKDLISEGFHVVVAAGNNGQDACNFSPSSEKTAIVAGCIDSNGVMCTFTNKGPCVTIYAPGQSIKGLSIVGSINKSGTSVSVPHVIGMGALVLEIFPKMTQSRLISFLKETSFNNQLRLFKNCSTCNKSYCKFFRGHGCQFSNFCSFKTRRECLSYKRCFFNKKCFLKR